MKPTGGGPPVTTRPKSIRTNKTHMAQMGNGDSWCARGRTSYFITTDVALVTCPKCTQLMKDGRPQ